MRAKLDNMLAIPLKSLKADEALPFPIYLWLKLNDRLIGIRVAGEALGEEKYQEFLKQNLAELWVPSEFQQKFLQYLDQIEGKVQTLSEVIENGPEALATVAEAAPPEELPEEIQLVRDVLEETGLTKEEKAEVLSAIGQDLLRSLNQISDRGEEPRRQGLKRCRQLADEILEIAYQHKSIYDEIVAIRSSQDDMEHSMIVGTVAVMFALAVGESDKELLADMTLAGLFHDIGLTKVNPAILNKPEVNWSGPERHEYEGHILAGVKLLEDSSKEFSPSVFRMIREHHENHDGSGYPEGRQGGAIGESSQFLHLGNLFDKFCTGKIDGVSLSPQEAFQRIAEIATNPKAIQEVSPDTIKRVFQCLLQDVGGMAKIQKDMQNRGDRAMKEIVGT